MSHIGDLVQEEHHQMWGKIEVGYRAYVQKTHFYRYML